MKEKMMERLDSDTYEALVYIGYYLPKSQRELEKMIFSPKKKVNITPLIRARKKLSELGWLSEVTSHELRGRHHKSLPEPFIAYLKKISDERESTKGDEFRLTSVDMKYIEMLMSSEYIRQNFFSEQFFEMCYAVHRSRIKRNLEGKLVVESAFYIIEKILLIIAFHAIQLQDEDYKIRDLYISKISNVIDNYKNFDDFLKKHFEKFEKLNLKEHLLKNPKMDKLRTKLETNEESKYLYNHIVFNGLFLLLPLKLALKIIAIVIPSPVLSSLDDYKSDVPVLWFTPELSNIEGLHDDD